jgi:hypothetical protein
LLAILEAFKNHQKKCQKILEESRSEELLEEIRQRSTTSISAESQIYP